MVFNGTVLEDVTGVLECDVVGRTFVNVDTSAVVESSTYSSRAGASIH